MQAWQHPSTVGAVATRSQMQRIEQLEHALGRKHATLLLGPAFEAGAFSIGITMDSQTLRTASRASEKCGLLFRDGFIAWGSRDDMLRETPLVEKWTQRLRYQETLDRMKGHHR